MTLGDDARDTSKGPPLATLLHPEFTERTPDGHPQVWLLYRPEPFPPGDISERQINLWVRRADVFTSRERAVHFLAALIGEVVEFRPYDPLFPELWIGHSDAGHRWLLCPAPLNPPGRDA